MDPGGPPRFPLHPVAQPYPMVTHCVSPSIGRTDPFNLHYLRKLKQLADQIGALWISDHLCWTGVMGANTHDLLPVPMSEESLSHIVRRIRTVQDFLVRPLILDNQSTYLTFADPMFTEWGFLSRIPEHAD